MVVADDVWCDDYLPFGMLVEESDENILVGWPTASCHEHLMVLLECLHNRQMLGLLHYL